MLRRIYNLKFKGITFEAGHFYSFSHYRRFENDPSPLILFMYGIRGTPPNTGHRWNLIQAWNLSYIPLKLRRPLIKTFVYRNMNIRTYQPKTGIRIGQDYFPSYLDVAIRRYLIIPASLIVNPREISYESIDAEIMKIAKKDYFTRAQIQRVRRLMNRPVFRIKKKPKLTGMKKPARPRKARPRRKPIGRK